MNGRNKDKGGEVHKIAVKRADMAKECIIVVTYMHTMYIHNQRHINAAAETCDLPTQSMTTIF